MKKEIFTTNEAAEELGVSSARVRQMVLDGSLPASRFGRALVISAEAIEAARNRKTSPGPAARGAQATTAKPRARKGKETSK
jgi:excisionase family DNA binding protein